MENMEDIVQILWLYRGDMVNNIGEISWRYVEQYWGNIVEIWWKYGGKYGGLWLQPWCDHKPLIPGQSSSPSSILLNLFCHAPNDDLLRIRQIQFLESGKCGLKVYREIHMIFNGIIFKYFICQFHCLQIKANIYEYILFSKPCMSQKIWSAVYISPRTSTVPWYIYFPQY